MGMTLKEQQKLIQERVDKIAMLLSKGFSTYKDIYEFAEEEGWGLSTRTIDNYIKKAHSQLTKIVFKQMGNVQDFAISNFNSLLREALKRNELDLAFKVMKEVYKIGGAYQEIEKEEVEAKVNIKHSVSKEEIAKRIDNEDF